MVWQTAIGSSGSMYPVIKFPEVIGDVKSLSMKRTGLILGNNHTRKQGDEGISKDGDARRQIFDGKG